MSKCPKCGQEVTAGNSVCIHCGAKLGNIPAHIQSPKNISIITDDDTVTSKITDTGDRPVAGIISLLSSIIALIAMSVFLSLGMHHAGDEGWGASTIAVLFVIMAFATTGIMSGLIGLNHPRKTTSIIGLVLACTFVAILGYIITTSLKG